MTTTPRSPHPVTQDGIRQEGTTIIEMVIVTILTAMILSMFYGSASSVSTVTIQNNQELKSRAKQSDVLENIRTELEQSGNDSRYTIPAGGKSIIYTKLIGAQRSGADVSGLWSQTFRIERTSKGEVVRMEGSKGVSWGSGVIDLRFAQAPGEAFISITCVTRQKGRDQARTTHVYPRN